MKENTFFETDTFQGDGTTIKYDATKRNRSDAVGKAFRINDDGKGALVADGEEIDGIVLQVASDDKFTGAYLFGGLFFLIGDNQTVSKGDKIVGALGPSNAKGYIKSAPDITALPTALADLEAADINDDTEKLAAYNAARTAINAVSTTVRDLIAANKGKGNILNFDTTKALVRFNG